MRFPSLIIEKASYSFAHIIGGLVVFIKTECGVILDFDRTPVLQDAIMRNRIFLPR